MLYYLSYPGFGQTLAYWKLFFTSGTYGFGCMNCGSFV